MENLARGSCDGKKGCITRKEFSELDRPSVKSFLTTQPQGMTTNGLLGQCRVYFLNDLFLGKSLFS